MSDARRRHRGAPSARDDPAGRRALRGHGGSPARRHTLPVPPGWRALSARSRVALPAGGRARPLDGGESRLVPVDGSSVYRARPGRPGHLRITRGDLHRRRHVRGHRSAPAEPRGAGRHRRGADAGGGVSGLAQLGLRRRAPVRGPVDVRRPARPAAPRRRLPRPRGVGAPRRRLQPSRPRGKLPRRVRALLHRPLPHTVGRRGQLRRPRGRGRTAPLRRERARLGARVPRRRAPARRHPRDLRRQPDAHPHRDHDGGARGGTGAGPAHAHHGRVARQRSAHRVAGRRGRHRAGRRVVGRLPPRRARAADRRAPRLLRGLHRAAAAGHGAGRRLCVPGRVLRVLWPRPRHAQRRPPGRSLRRLRAEPRPGRQPRPG